jgi:excisionase family DNA binding protein
MPVTEDWMTPKEAAEALRIKPLTLTGWLRNGVITGKKLGTGPKARWRVSRAEVKAAVHNRQGSGLSPEDMQETVQAICDCLKEGTGLEANPESLEEAIEGMKAPLPQWWRSLANGIRALQARANDCPPER